MLLRCTVCATFAVGVAVAAASAQPPGAITTDVFTRLVWLEAGAQHVWRGIDVGDAALVAGAALSWGESGAQTTQWNLLAEGRTAATQRGPASDRLRLGGTVVRQLTDEGTSLWLGVDAFALPNASGRTRAELSAGTRFRLPRWLPERRPTVLLDVHRAFSDIDANYARAAVQFDYKFGVSHGAFIEVGHAWSDFAGGISPDFDVHGTDLTITYVRQADPTATRTSGSTRSIEPFVRVLWTKLNGDPNLLDAGLRIAWVH